MKIDLHTHTQASDGQYSSVELINNAEKLGIDVIAITDHDTIDGLEEAMEYSKKVKIEVIPGIEFSAKVTRGKMHILGLGINYLDKELIDITNELKKNRNERNEKLIELFNNEGIDVSLSDVKKYVEGNVIAKPHFSQALLEKGYISTVEEGFKKYFDNPPYNQVKRILVEPKKIIEIIKKANGISILAHPQSLKLTDNELEEKIQELISYGLDGLECYHSKQTNEQMDLYKKIAKKYNLLISKGSDFHGEKIKPDIKLGIGINNNILKEDDTDIYGKIKEKLKKYS